ncbi:MAG: hypothetical protein H8D34_04605 [Chloroflexi bacterium]|nr:hypothetical protein [Chloroflexota bacterium]
MEKVLIEVTEKEKESLVGQIEIGDKGVAATCDWMCGSSCACSCGRCGYCSCGREDHCDPMDSIWS